jgi:hypothetical protein
MAGILGPLIHRSLDRPAETGDIPVHASKADCPMPTLIRLLVVLLVLAGLAFGAMFALVATVTPRDKQVTIRIPARDLVPTPDRDPLVRREIDTSRPVTPVETPAAEVPAAETPDAAPAEGADADGVVTLQQGTE